MKEEIILFETAQLAKEKGFNIPCNLYYYIDNMIHSQKDKYHKGRLIDRNIYPNQYSAPTQALLQKWFRKVYNIDIHPSLLQKKQKL